MKINIQIYALRKIKNEMSMFEKSPCLVLLFYRFVFLGRGTRSRMTFCTAGQIEFNTTRLTPGRVNENSAEKKKKKNVSNPLALDAWDIKKASLTPVPGLIFNYMSFCPPRLPLGL